MKRVAILSSLIAVGGFSGGAARAADGSINFKGSLTAAPCSIDSASSSQNIDFGTVSTSAFGDIGSAGPSKAFQIELTGCDTSTYKQAAIRFDGVATSTSMDLLSTSNASLGIELTDTQGDRVKLGSPSSFEDLNPATTGHKDGNAVLHFRARYSALKKAADMTAGQASGNATFSVNYK